MSRQSDNITQAASTYPDNVCTFPLCRQIIPDLIRQNIPESVHTFPLSRQSDKITQLASTQSVNITQSNRNQISSTRRIAKARRRIPATLNPDFNPGLSSTPNKKFTPNKEIRISPIKKVRFKNILNMS